MKSECKRIQIFDDNSLFMKFSARDIIIASLGSCSSADWKSFDQLIMDLENIGADFVFSISKAVLKRIIENLEDEDLVSVNWDIETLARNF